MTGTCPRSPEQGNQQFSIAIGQQRRGPRFWAFLLHFSRCAGGRAASAALESPSCCDGPGCPVISWITGSGPRLPSSWTLGSGSWRERYSKSTTAQMSNRRWFSVGNPRHASGTAECLFVPGVWFYLRRPGVGSGFAWLWQKDTSSRNETGCCVTSAVVSPRAAKRSAISGSQGCPSIRISMEPTFAAGSQPLLTQADAQKVGVRSRVDNGGVR
jgi:hypothetical protein